MSDSDKLNNLEDVYEYAYWVFDARRKGYNTYTKGAYSERDDFKWALRESFAKYEKDNEKN